MTTITRFAPSPTGFIHVGNVRMALINYLLAKKLNGKFILRIDNTDLERSKQEYEEALKKDLLWLKIKWDSTFRQSENIDLYNKYLEKLKQQNLIYACYETREELEYKRKLQLAKGAPPIYDRVALKLTDAAKQAFEKEGRKPYYRFKILPEDIEWNDLVKGSIKMHGSNLSDPVIIKENGVFLYSFSSVVDDIESKITHIVRGEDHVSNTAFHIQLFKCLGSSIPKFAHMSLLSSIEGSQLSKREGSNSIMDFRDKGIHSLAILNYLFTLGQSENNHIYTSIEGMVDDFSLSNYGKSAVKFDNNKLYQINNLVLQGLDFNSVKKDLEELKISNVTEEIWKLYKYNIESLNDINKYQDVLYGNISYKPSNKNLIKIALEFFPQENFTNNNIDEWINKIAALKEFNKKEIFKSLREALTGETSGPNFKDLLFALGYTKVKERLTASLL